MGYNVGAKVTTNVDAYNVQNSSPEVLFFPKNISQTYAFGMFAKLVMPWGHGNVHPFFVVGSKQKLSKTIRRQHYCQLKGWPI